jgi:hypothetical protein
VSNTHYAIIVFSGDPAGEHPADELNGQPPSMNLIASGPADWCWEQIARWTTEHPLRMWEEAEVVERDPALVATQEERARACRAALRAEQGPDLGGAL